jgi:hypothetical protein
MASTRRLAIALVALGLLLVPVAVPAQPAPPPDPRAPPMLDPEHMARAEAMAREAVTRLLGAFDAFVQSLPQYDAPEINERGDIIIRRRNPRRDAVPLPPGDDEDEHR